jgi:hypothetical protein
MTRPSPHAPTFERTPAPAGWVESLERSRREIDAGQTMPLEPVLDRLRKSLAELEESEDSPPKP